MKTRKTILNDAGKPMTKIQAKKEAQAFILEQVLESFAEGGGSAEIQFDGTVDAAGEVTLSDLLELSGV